MNEDIKDIKELETTDLTSVKDLAEKIKELQRTSIPKEEYEQAVKKLKEENSQLITALTENKPIILNEDETAKADRAAEISGRLKAHSKGEKRLSDKEMLRLALEQRELMIDLSGVDTLVGRTMEGHTPIIDKEDAEEMAYGLKEIINYADEHHLELTEAVKSLQRKGELKF